jgi:hypothetical protein
MQVFSTCEYNFPPPELLQKVGDFVQAPKMSNYSTMFWREQVIFDEMIMISALY